MPYRTIIRNILWMLTERGAQIAGGIAVSGLLARSLGAAQFGLFQYAQSLVFLAASLTLIGARAAMAAAPRSAPAG